MNKENNTPTLKWVYRQSKRYIPAVIAISVLGAVISVGYVLLALFSRDVIDIATGEKNGSLLKSGTALLGVVIFQVLANAANSVISVRINGRMTISLRNRLFSALMNKKYPTIASHHSGDLLNRFTSDVDVVISGVTSIIPNTLSTITKIIAGIGTLIALNGYLAIIVFILGISVPAIGRAINKRYKYLHKECQRTEGMSRSFLQECFQNTVVIKSFISELPFLKKLNQYMLENYRLKIKRNNITLLASICLFAFFSVGYYGVLLWGAGQIAAGAITYGTLTAFLQLISQLRAPLQNVSGIMPQYYSMIASAERLIEIEKGESEQPPETEHRLEAVKSAFKTIEARGIDFAYDDEQILKNCSFSIERGKITAITGESGSGKSTLFKIMLGLYEPQKGSIAINGDIPLNSSTRGLFAYVPQGNMVLSGTLRENITLWDSSVSEEEVIRAAKTAVIYDFIETLPNGLDTVVSERGSGLSEGQIQRIAIARALLYDAPILLFDESTSALDEATETQLLKNIKALPDKTVIFITHRGTSISVCDHVIHVEDKQFVLKQ